ncbi:MAG: Rpn family recombination-promoting nuclease/putative transposase [Lachnospiraceae bacterium]|jgi:predicted transposase/invertase (TIGR01784 family)|nr:Rpn family recombination-promoting nuclease/putative transposase [Lachnospiraceae bacterium]
MDSTGIKEVHKLSKIDFDLLMDLRVDYAFKLLFTKGDPRLLVSLLSAVFANKGIKRAIKSSAIKNPFLEKEAEDDKLSSLDIRAELDDGISILIEMHMYGLGDLKAKTIRSWARAYGEEREPGEKYSDQPPAVVIAFVDGQVHPIEKKPGANKIHRYCMIMDREDCAIFTDAMELHYIDMNAFAKAVNEAGSIEIGDTVTEMFAKWLSIITQKEIADKSLIERACETEEDIKMAVSTLARQGEDKYTRQAYQRHLDDIYYYNKEKYEYEQKLADKDRQITELKARLGEK